jgi:hypothetical protein
MLGFNPVLRSPVKALVSILSMLRAAVTVPVSVIVDKVSKDIREWIKALSQVRKELNGYSICPFALSASFSIKECSLSDINPIDGVDVAIFVVGDITLSELQDACKVLNEKYQDYMFLDDHISEPTYINGVQTNCGKYNLMLVQRRDKLLSARKSLHKTKYYELWSDVLYNRIVKG